MSIISLYFLINKDWGFYSCCCDWHLTVQLEFTALCTDQLRYCPGSGGTSPHVPAFHAQVGTRVHLTHVELSVTHLGFTGGTRGRLLVEGVPIVGQFLGLVVLEAKTIGHFAANVALVVIGGPNRKVSAAGPLTGTLRAHKGALVKRTAIQIAHAFCLGTRRAVQVGGSFRGQWRISFVLRFLFTD